MVKNSTAMDFIKLVEIFYTLSDKSFLVKLELNFMGKQAYLIIADSMVIA